MVFIGKQGHEFDRQKRQDDDKTVKVEKIENFSATRSTVQVAIFGHRGGIYTRK